MVCETHRVWQTQLSIPRVGVGWQEKCGSEDVSHEALTPKFYRVLWLVGARRPGLGRGWTGRSLPGEMPVGTDEGV